MQVSLSLIISAPATATATATVVPAAIITPKANITPSGSGCKKEKSKNKKPLDNPFQILVDDREVISGGVWPFRDIIGDSKEGYRPLNIKTQVKRMLTGDYSIVGLDQLVVVERKALNDIYSTIGQRRDEFELEHQRMAAIRRNCIDTTNGAIQSPCHVVIEADWATIIKKESIRSQLNPMAIIGVASHWSMRYGVQWWAMPGRRAAELWAFWLLRNFWRQWQHAISDEANSI